MRATAGPATAALGPERPRIDPLRQGQFHRAENLLAGLVVLPDPVRAEILEAVRKPSRVDGPVGEAGGTWV